MKIDFLTARENEVAELISNAANNNEIAEKLNMSEGTAKQHVKNIFRKSGVNSKLKFAVKYLKGTLTKSEDEYY